MIFWDFVAIVSRWWCSVAQSCLTLCHLMDCSTPGFPVLHYLPQFTQTHVHWVDDAIQPSHAVTSFSSIFPIIRVFSSESALDIRWAKNWSFSFRISPSNEYSGLISFRKGQSVPGHKSIQNGNNSQRTHKLASPKRKSVQFLYIEYLFLLAILLAWLGENRTREQLDSELTWSQVANTQRPTSPGLNLSWKILASNSTYEL